MSISKIGKRAEQYVADYLFKKGWFVILIQNKIAGQPFDLIALKDDKFIAGDVKHIQSGDTFRISRVEPNQHTAFFLMRNKGNTNFGLFFKFKCDMGVYYIRDSDINWDAGYIKKSEMSKL